MSKQQSVTLFDFDDYRLFVRKWIEALPKRGRGKFKSLGEAMGMQSSLVSQVFGGSKSLTLEQAALLCEALGLNELESDYFMKLVELDRAGNEALRRMLRRQMLRIRSTAREVGSRLQKKREMSEADQAIFYSSWLYSAVRLGTLVPRYRSLEALADLWKAPRTQVRRVLDFLESRKLIIQKHDGFERSEANTHIPARSMLSTRHHKNWREIVSRNLDSLSDEELAFTAPLAISEKDFDRVRKLLLESIGSVSKIVEDSPSERLACLTIDWGFLDRR